MWYKKTEDDREAAAAAREAAAAARAAAEAHRLSAAGQHEKIKQKLSEQWQDPERDAKKYYVRRTDLENKIKRRLLKMHNTFLIMCGEKGSGKSWTLTQVLNGRSHTIVVYLENDVSEEMFLRRFCAATGIDFDALTPHYWPSKWTDG